MAEEGMFAPPETVDLTFLYLRNQDLSDKTPEEIQDMFYEIYYNLIRNYRQMCRDGVIQRRKEQSKL